MFLASSTQGKQVRAEPVDQLGGVGTSTHLIVHYHTSTALMSCMGSLQYILSIECPSTCTRQRIIVYIDFWDRCGRWCIVTRSTPIATRSPGTRRRPNLRSLPLPNVNLLSRCCGAHTSQSHVMKQLVAMTRKWIRQWHRGPLPLSRTY